MFCSAGSHLQGACNTNRPVLPHSTLPLHVYRESRNVMYSAFKNNFKVAHNNYAVCEFSRFCITTALFLRIAHLYTVHFATIVAKCFGVFFFSDFGL